MLAIVHLSDIHFRDDQPNVLLERSALLAGAIATSLRDATAVVMLVSGDIAYHGREAEYEIATQFFRDLESQLAGAQSLAAAVEWICVPGNHDCNHALANQLRTAAISRAQTSGRPDSSTITLATNVLQPYFAFEEKLVQNGIHTAHSLVGRHKIAVGDRHVGIQTINAAWCSTDPESYGGLWLPSDAIRALQPWDVDVSVAVVHYPINWFDYETRRSLRRAIDVASQLVLTGHEHQLATETIATPEGFQCECIAAGVLQHGQDHSSEFSVILVDPTSRDLTQHRFHWNSTSRQYERGSLSYSTKLLKRRVAGDADILDFTSSFEDFINDVGLPISHPNEGARHLSDFFVWPDVSLWTGKSWDKRQILSSKRLLDSRDKSYVLAGAERSGKTALGKQLVKYWHAKGLLTLWVDAPALEARFRRGVDVAITDAIENQFGAGTSESFLQVPPKEKCIVIDDFHLLSREVDREGLLHAVGARFGTVILLASDDWVMEQTASRDRLPKLFAFQMARLLPCGPRLRAEIVTKWLTLIPTLQHDPQVLQRRIHDLVSQMDAVLGHDLVVPYPSTLLIILQTVTAQGATDVNHGSLGHTYHKLVHTRLASGVSPAQLNMRMRYLTELAWAIFSSRESALSLSAMDEWHQQHVDRFNLGNEAQQLPRDLCDCGMLDNRGGIWHFRHKYVYFYFVAEHINQQLHTDAIKEVLKGLVLRLHNEDASNIFAFVAFKSRNDAVLSMLLDRARTLYADYAECDVIKDCEQLDALAREVPKLVFAQEQQQSIRDSMLSERDGHERSRDPKYAARDTHLHVEAESSYLQEFMTSMRLVTVLGQVVRNHAGQLEAEKMESLVEATYSLALRTLSNLLDGVVEEQEMFVRDVIESMKEKNPGVSLGALQTQVANRMIVLIEMAACGILRHAASSVGMGELMSTTLESVRTRATNGSVEIIDTSIDLDRSRVYPRDRVLHLAKRLAKSPFAQGVFRMMCLINFYVFRVPEPDRQAVCAELDINMNQSAALAYRAKLPATRVTAKPTGERHGYKKRRKKR